MTENRPLPRKAAKAKATSPRARKPQPPEPEPAPPPPAPEPVRRPRMPSGFTTVRDVLLFGVGVAIIIHEVFLSKTVDPTSVGIGVALTGAPLVFGADERKPK